MSVTAKKPDDFTGNGGGTSIHDRLKFARINAGFHSASAFARKFDIDGQTYRRHESGERQIPTTVVADYAHFLDVDLHWLITGSDDHEKFTPATQNRHVHHVPVISWIDAGRPGFALDDTIDIKGTIPVMTRKSTLFALQVRGNSMNRVAPAGAHILVDHADIDLIDGKMYIVRFENDLVFKRYRNNGREQWLEPDSTDPDHRRTITIERDAAVVGRVVAVYNPV